MSIFPSNPQVGDEFSGKRWNGTAWEVIGVDLSRDYTLESEFTSHTSASSSVHGIPDTSVLATQSYVDSAIASFEALPDQTSNSGQFLTTDGSTTSWSELPDTAPFGGGTNEIFYENDKTITENYTITTNKNAISAGPITIDAGVSVTVPSGSTWSIV